MSRGKNPTQGNVFGRPRQAMGLRSHRPDLPQTLEDLKNFSQVGNGKVKTLEKLDWVWHDHMVSKIREIKLKRERDNDPASYSFERNEKERQEFVNQVAAYQPELPDKKIGWDENEGNVGARNIIGTVDTGWLAEFKILEDTHRTWEARGSGSSSPVRYRIERTGVNIREMFETSWDSVRMRDTEGNSVGMFNIYMQQWKTRKNQKNFKKAGNITPWVELLPDEDPKGQTEFLHSLLTRMQESKFEFCDFTLASEDNPAVYAALGAEFIEAASNVSSSQMSEFSYPIRRMWEANGLEFTRPEEEKRLACLSVWEVYGGKERAKHAANQGWIDFALYKGLEQYMERIKQGTEETPSYADLFDIGKDSPWKCDIYDTPREWHLGDWLLYGAGGYLRVDLKKPLPTLNS